MFVRVKKVGLYQYLQIAQHRREGKRVKQSIIATLGRRQVINRFRRLVSCPSG